LLPLLPSVDPASTPFDLFPEAATLELSFDLDDPSFAFPGPTWQLPDVPAETLVPFAGPAPQCWKWVLSVRPLGWGVRRTAVFHYVVEVTPATMLSYYRKALRQAGWSEGLMGPLESGDYSYLTHERYGRATIYISPRDGGSLVSILVE
jgi:hypothetical protein